jgi:hypothetical protein
MLLDMLGVKAFNEKKERLEFDEIVKQMENKWNRLSNSDKEKATEFIRLSMIDSQSVREILDRLIPKVKVEV